ncbi:hypothetical protein PROFUN_16439 [Planoprotostelium fungivorum]|uniref:Uncharacterized protein n=1 Tax=Planoprotostelium fungivorum TaxID=1890364 RepID=A0A2P6MQ45_9EUKA|nr:hypothetical protein PROFUN_16439 [Planoprotostelium fungivorum]
MVSVLHLPCRPALMNHIQSISILGSASYNPRSLPKKKEPYSNLITKIMTGTIWTNKRKKQYNLTEDDSCKFCSDIMEESIMDSHQHTLGECIFTRELNDQLWTTLKQFWDKICISSSRFRFRFYSDISLTLLGATKPLLAN